MRARTAAARLYTLSFKPLTSAELKAAGDFFGCMLSSWGALFWVELDQWTSTVTLGAAWPTARLDYLLCLSLLPSRSTTEPRPAGPLLKNG